MANICRVHGAFFSHKKKILLNLFHSDMTVVGTGVQRLWSHQGPCDKKILVIVGWSNYRFSFGALELQVMLLCLNNYYIIIN